MSQYKTVAVKTLINHSVVMAKEFYNSCISPRNTHKSYCRPFGSEEVGGEDTNKKLATFL